MKRKITNLELELWNTGDPNNPFAVLARKFPYIYIQDEDPQEIFILSKFDKSINIERTQTAQTTRELEGYHELLNIQYSVLAWDENKEFRQIEFPSIDNEKDTNMILVTLSWVINHYQTYNYKKFMFIDNDELMSILNKIDAKQSWIIHNLEK